MDTSCKVQIPDVIIASEFPDRDQIKVLSEWKPDEIQGDIEVYNISRRKLITVEFPIKLFSYNPETLTLSHLTFPEFDVCNEHDDILYWYLSREGEDNLEVVKNRCLSFVNYLCQQNLMSDVFRFCTRLKYLGYDKWHAYPHPNKYYSSYRNETINVIYHFDPTKYLIRPSETWSNGIELVDLSNNSIFFTFRININRHAFNRRYLLGI